MCKKASPSGEGITALLQLSLIHILKHYAGALCAAFATGGDVTGGNSQFYFVTALPDSVSSGDQQAELTANGYTCLLYTSRSASIISSIVRSGVPSTALDKNSPSM